MQYKCFLKIKNTINIYMGNIRLNTLTEPEKALARFKYSDLHLDLKIGYTDRNELLKQSEKKDLVADYDYGAIKNSLFNLFTTIPGRQPLTMRMYMGTTVPLVQATVTHFALKSLLLHLPAWPARPK
jgi:hypothetical protein